MVDVHIRKRSKKPAQCSVTLLPFTSILCSFSKIAELDGVLLLIDMAFNSLITKKKGQLRKKFSKNRHILSIK